MSILRARRSVSAVPRGGEKGAKAPASGVGSVATHAHVLDVPFAMRGVAAASGARWDAEHGVFVWNGDTLPHALSPFRALPYSWELHVERELAASAPRTAAKPTGNIVLRSHQEQAARSIVLAREGGRAGFLLADDVGLGKTISAWEAVLRMKGASTVLVVCPLAVVAHWRRTIEAMGDGGRDVIVLNYDRLGKLFDVSAEARKKIRTKKGLARAGTAPEFDVVIWDESHRCKNPTAARSKLAAKLNANAGFRLWLSATAGQNPLELSYLAPLLASVTGTRAADLKDFEQWCLQQGLASDLAAGIRRRPEDIAGWPAINRILTPIDLDGEARSLYDQAWTEFREAMELAPRGRDPKSALAATLRLRQKSSLVRAEGTVELARELLENGHQVAISVAFIETHTSLRASLEGGLGGVPCAAIHGAIPASLREEERLRFQRGDARVVLFTVEEGISLHQGETAAHGKNGDRPRSEVIHDLRWSAIQMAQIEGRCHRDGRFAQVYWAYAADTIEERIAQVVARRIQSMKEMIGDDVETLREIERVLFDTSGAS